MLLYVNILRHYINLSSLDVTKWYTFFLQFHWEVWNDFYQKKKKKKCIIIVQIRFIKHFISEIRATTASLMTVWAISAAASLAQRSVFLPTEVAFTSWALHSTSGDSVKTLCAGSRNASYSSSVATRWKISVLLWHSVRSVDPPLQLAEIRRLHE